MKTTLTAIALILAVAAPSFAQSNSQLRNSVENKVRRIDSSIVLPELSNSDLAFIKSIAEDRNRTNNQKSHKIRFHISKRR